MKRVKIIVLLLFAAFVFALVIGQAAAPTQLFVDGSTSWERARIERLEHQLNFTKEPMPNEWDIHIIPEGQFIENVQHLHVGFTQSAYTAIPIDQTYLNEGYLMIADDRRVRHTLAHEAGHMICNCTSEVKAEAIAYQLEQ